MYQLFQPPHHLRHMVRHYWMLDREGKSGITEYLFAYPYVNWVFTLGEPYTVSDDLRGKMTITDTRVLGPRTHFATYGHPEGNRTFGVTFQFGAALPVFKTDMGLLTNNIVAQEDILPRTGWLSAYFAETTLDTFRKGLSDQLAHLSKGPMDGKGHRLWRQFVELLTHGKHFSANALDMAKELKISQRQLQRITLRYSGLSPKTVQSMVRCRMALRSIQITGQMNDLFGFGYYDQNHFIKEVKRWSGHTPKNLLELLSTKPS
ncbi:helix-turn-helix transcriptional regulator [Muricauda sp. NFXS6]|uniref:AraC family transcriptional regulator n=1 Tax=Allomuricauda sp. NFXS6 TaxID=2819094 RepID=UPI0032DF0E14